MLGTIIFLVVLLMLSGFFSSSETAFTSLSLIQIQEIKQKYPRRGKMIEKMNHKPEVLLTTVLIGNNLVNVGLSVMTSNLAFTQFNSEILGLLTGILTMVILVFGEVIPKQLAIQNNKFICVSTIQILVLLSYLFYPLILFMNLLGRLVAQLFGSKRKSSLNIESILHMVKHAENIGILENYKTRMVRSIFRFSDISVHAIMTHRKDVFSLEDSISLNEALPKISGSGFSRIPVYKDNPENITGIVLEKDIVRHLGSQGETAKKLKLYEIAMEPVIIPETWKIQKAFLKIRKDGANLAVILDEYGGLSGVVSIEDIVEEIVGQFQEDSDDATAQTMQKDGWFYLAGDTPIYLLEDITGISIDIDKSIETVGGYLVWELGAIPLQNQEIKTSFGTFVALNVSRKQVLSIKFQAAQLQDD